MVNKHNVMLKYIFINIYEETWINRRLAGGQDWGRHGELNLLDEPDNKVVSKYIKVLIFKCKFL